MSSVNDQITDSISQNLTLLTGNAAPQGVSMVDVVSAESMGIFMHNAVMSQQNSQLTSNASVTATCARMLNIQQRETVAEQIPGPPPFMPLTTDSDKTAELVKPTALLQQAQALVDSALKSVDKDKDTDTEVEAAIQKMLDSLKATTSQSDDTGGGTDAEKK